MPHIVVNDLVKSFDEVTAISDVSLEIDDGEFLVLLGPSGCGKTTTLRCIAGVEQPNAGEIRFGDRTIFSSADEIDVPPRNRNIGLVFQNYALYPHMTVYQNVAFGLKNRGMPREEIPFRVKESLHLVELEEFAGKRPGQLSGGQQQRVAVARMIAARPEVLLFDEPLSNLDPTLRVSVRTQLRKLHERLGTTSLYVTHDHSEAYVLADRIAVMENGRIVQIGSGSEIYRHPKTVQVADFTGNPKTNLIAGEIHRSEGGILLVPDPDPYCFISLDPACGKYASQRVIVHVRPEDVEMVPNPTEDEARLEIFAVLPQGPDALVILHIGSKEDHIVVRAVGPELIGLSPGGHVSIRFRKGNIFSKSSGMLLDSF